MVITDWYASTSNQIEIFETADGSTISNGQLKQLFQAMTTFSAENGGITWEQALQESFDESQAILAANW